MRWPGLITSLWSKLKMALSSSSELVVGVLRLELERDEAAGGVGVGEEVGVVGRPVGGGEEGRRLSRGSEPFVLIPPVAADRM